MNRSRRLSLPIAALAAAVAVLLPGAAPAGADETDGGGLSQRIDEDQAVARDDAVLDLGHVDLGPKYLDDEWTLMVHDDTQLEGSVWRPLDHVVVRVKDTALIEAPDDPAYDFLGVDPGTSVHVVPQTQNNEVVWLGWNTQDPQVMDTVDRGVTLSLAGVEGPGHLVVYLQDGGFGDPDVLWDSRLSEQQPLWVDANTHTHANWVFTEPGVYRVAVEASATLVDGSEVEALGTIRFAIGDDSSAQEALAAAALDVADAAVGEDASATQAEAEAGSADEGGGGVSPALWLLGAALVLAAATALLLVRGRRVRSRALGVDQ